MKGNKKILAIAILFLVIAVSYGTYAIYKSSATSSDSVRPAAWVVNVGSTDIVANNTFTLGSLDCSGGSQVAKASGTIAPGDSCTATITIDASGSEVGVNYTVAVDQAALTALHNSNISVSAHEGSSLTDSIPYGASMTRNVVLDITWTATDSTAQNASDIATSLIQNAEIPVTVTVTQNPAS